MSDIVQTLMKLLELSRRGVGGEKDTAAAKLESLMAKHGITMEDLGIDVRKTEWFQPRSGDLYVKLMTQTIHAVTGGTRMWKSTMRKRWIGADVTKAEEIEIRLRYDAYCIGMKKELDIFFSAFLHTNMVFPPSRGEDKPDVPLTPEEEWRVRKIALAMMGMERVQVRKQIGGGS